MHSFRKLMVAPGLDADLSTVMVADQVGHANPSETLNTYASSARPSRFTAQTIQNAVFPMPYRVTKTSGYEPWSSLLPFPRLLLCMRAFEECVTDISPRFRVRRSQMAAPRSGRPA